MIDCDSCGFRYPVADDALTVECPRCGAGLELVVKVGDRVSYEDAANPPKEGVVVEGPRDGQYRVKWDEPEPFASDDPTPVVGVWSDLRQAGWKRVARPALGTAIRRVERLMETARFSSVTNEALEVVLDAARKRR